MIIEKKECFSCKYKGWDCKSCDILDNDSSQDDMFFPSVVFTIVLTRQCNLRCDYCGIHFTEDVLQYETIDTFLSKIHQFRRNINRLKFEFFGGEPLLEFEKIKYIVEKTSFLDIKYSIVTNGFFFTQEIIDFLNQSNFEVVFSVAIHTLKLLTEKKELFLINTLNHFIINFIIEPGKEALMYKVFIDLFFLGFRKITILPVYYTKVWSQDDLYNLDLLLKKISLFYTKILSKKNISFDIFYIRTNKEFEFNIKKQDIEIFLDYDGKFYGDYETELRLLKDYISEKVFSINEILIGDLYGEHFSFLHTLVRRKSIRTVTFMNKITDFLNIDENLKLLGEVINRNNVNNFLNGKN